MKIHRPIAYGKTIRVTFSKRNDTTTDKRAITIIEATKQERLNRKLEDSPLAKVLA